MAIHGEGAIAALRPGRVLLPPDAHEDLWSEGYLEQGSLL